MGRSVRHRFLDRFLNVTSWANGLSPNSCFLLKVAYDKHFQWLPCENYTILWQWAEKKTCLNFLWQDTIKSSTYPQWNLKLTSAYLFVYLLMNCLCILFPSLHISILSIPRRTKLRTNRLFDSCHQLGSHFLVINSRKHPICPSFSLPFCQDSSLLLSVYQSSALGFPVCFWKG